MAILCCAGAALAQDLAVYEHFQSCASWDLSTTPSLAVGNQIVVAGSHRMMLYNKFPLITTSTIPLDERFQGATFPFTPATYVEAPFVALMTWPDAAFDPYTGRTWIAYAESTGILPSSPPCFPQPLDYSIGCTSYLHLAASGAATVADFSDSDWTYITGSDSTTEGNGGPAFDVGFRALGQVQPFREDDGHEPADGYLTWLSMAFDENDVFVAGNDPDDCFDGDSVNQGAVIFIIPREFDPAVPMGPTTIPDGGRPDESDITIVRLNDLFVSDPISYIKAVDEPHEQYDNVTLFISTNGATAGGTSLDSLRLRGLFWNDDDSRWEVRQSLEADSMGGWNLYNTPFDTGFDLDSPNEVSAPTLQSSLYPHAAAGFRPAVEWDNFSSAVMTLDNGATRRERVFAVHAALAPSGKWAVQWYVIDPQLFDYSQNPPVNIFHDAPIPSDEWQPEIVAMGRITDDGATEPVNGHCYHPVLAVTNSGQLFIEYTFSDEDENQRIVRATINSTYDGVTSSQVLQTAPADDYGELDYRWAQYGDMQVDPAQCGIYSTHTLVGDEDTREVWLFRKQLTPFCFQTDLNQSGFTDTYDMMMYTDYYTAGDERADTDADGRVDAIDMFNFVDAYDRATAP